MKPFADRLADAVTERRSNLCLGLDPGRDAFGDLAGWGRRLIEACGGQCVAVKPQLACYERLGGEGWRALAETIAAAHDAGLLVVADGKRGDVPHTAAVYAEAMVGRDDAAPGGLGADSFTANPLAGGDSLDAMIDVAAAAQAGIFVLVRTSNAGAADFFDGETGDGTLAEAIAAALGKRAAALAGDSGLSGLGAVVGATAPEHLERLRARLPDSVFLVPGVGAQGASPDDIGPAVGSGPASVLVPVSRGITASGDPAAAAAELRERLWKSTGGR